MDILNTDNKEITPYCLITDSLSIDEAIKISKCKPKYADKLIIAIDHDTPSGTVEAAAKQRLLVNFSKQENAEKFDYGHGIGYYVAMEKYLKKGDVLLGIGEHIATVGAAGILGVRVDADTLTKVIESGSYELKIPERLVIEFTGSFEPGVTSKDAVLSLIKDNAAIKGKLVIFKETECFSFYDKAVLCNLLHHAGVYSVVFTDDDVKADIIYDLANVKLSAVMPGGFEEIVPSSGIDGLRVNQVFIGGCMGGSIDAMRIAAGMLRGKKVDKYVRVMFAPASSKVYEQMIDEGIVDIIMDSGALLMNQGCSACWAKSQGLVDDNEVFVTTGSINCRNWAGRSNNKIYITSVVTAVKCALTGNLYEN